MAPWLTSALGLLQHLTFAMIRVFLLLLCCSSLLTGASPKFPIDDSGRWSLPLRYWCHETAYEAAGSYAFLAEVTKLGPKPPPVEHQKLPLRFRSGSLKVHELLNPRPVDFPNLAKVRELWVEGLDGLKLGDRVIVFIDPEPYEGGFVINFHEGGCHVGIRLPPADDLSFGAESQALILKTLREDRTELRKLTSEELSAWITVDAKGIARHFQMELEMERLHWKEAAK